MVSNNSNALVSNKPMDLSTSSSVEDIFQEIKQSPWTKTIAITAVAGLGIVLTITGIYAAVDWKDGKEIKWPWNREQTSWWPWK
jgi:type IV secretory pathway VirB2 component (pilin)